MVASPRLGAYSLVATTPTEAESSSTAFQEKAASRGHSRNGSAAGKTPTAGAVLQAPPWRRLAARLTVALSALAVVVWLVRPLATPTQEVQINARHKMAHEFETSDVPSEWRCNPFKEPGRLQVDLKTPVRARFPKTLS